MNTPLSQALGISGGIVCAVGAGGKKSVLYRLLSDHPGRSAYTATVFTHNFPEALPAYAVVEHADRVVARVVEQARRHAKLAFACHSDKPSRHAGLSPEQVLYCHRECGFDLTLVKADGARMRGIKAPGENEPKLVADCAAIVGVVSVRAIGLRLDERHVHRPERFAALTGMRMQEVITPRHVAELMVAPSGLFKGAGRARRVAVINMVDRPHHRTAAVETARMALALSPDIERVVLTSMRAAAPVITVLVRGASCYPEI